MSSNNPSATINSSVWQWREWSGLPYLTCELLVDWQHGFFTQQCYPCTPEKLIKALDYQATTYRVKQVHGNTILTPQKIATTPKDENATFPDADGVITDGLNQGVWVASADCNPVLIGDLHTGRVAAVHAGWRGTAQRIVQKAIALFQEDGSNLADLRIAIGPAISGEVYQVSETVAAEVGKSILVAEIKKIVGDIPTQLLYEENHKSTELLHSAKKDILKALFEIENSPLLEDEQPGRVRLDIRRVNEIQLQQLGISDQQIAVSNHCTYQQPDYFFSYRRSKQKKVQWSGIVSKR
ncbi:Polyphenol oxidase [Hyella patelloides LEGE 07179]|uniref:Purine nucleoside phosphorylase n=1 Tax=Hyella patelloides LEGE 07179 TaxID=945734 RepID=A0A563VK63_9CYAN|nr:peptidoglycan editing factor PgeF [Hyella patelloides]VEP11733.1 Polyphenol oxidase [Hyella patelloides LEGE 07179]